MSTITSLFDQAQLAEAAYANFFNNTGGLVATTGELIAALQNRQNGSNFSPAQATAFANEWRVVDQYTAPAFLFGVGGTGFSATLFQNRQTGEYQFSMRGTEPGYADLAADLGDILADGIALDQTVEMYNYWQSLTHTGVYQAAKLETSLAETTTLNLLKAAAINPAGQLAYNAYLASLQQSGAILDNGIPLLVRGNDRILSVANDEFMNKAA